MRRWRRYREHLVDQGFVGCPARGRDVHLETCLACRWFEEIDETRDPPAIWCRPPVDSDLRLFTRV
jgi:hypothetical protein